MASVFFILCNILLVSVTSSTHASVNLKFDKNFAEPLAFAIALPVFQSEILANSIGIRTDTFSSLANSSIADRSTQVTAITILKLWTDLRTTEKALQIFSKAVGSLIKENSDAKISYDEILAKIDEAYIRDSNLGKQYELLKEETDRNLTTKPLFNTTALAELTDDKKKEVLEVELGPGLMLIHFTQELISGTNKNYQQVAEVCFKFAKDKEHFERIQNIFEQALKDSARLADKKSTSKQESTLFANIKQKIIHDTNLKVAMSKMKISLPDKL